LNFKSVARVIHFLKVLHHFEFLETDTGKNKEEDHGFISQEQKNISCLLRRTQQAPCPRDKDNRHNIINKEYEAAAHQ
jgi:hypothetical protein